MTCLVRIQRCDTEHPWKGAPSLRARLAMLVSVFALATPAGACSLDLGDLTAGSADASVDDGANSGDAPLDGTGAADGADGALGADAPLGRDAFVDASALDASITDALDASTSDALDASGDAALTDGGADSGTWCQRNHPTARFCMDFDEGQLTKAYAGGTLTFVPAPPADPGVTLALGTPASSVPAAFVANTGTVSSGKNILGEYAEPFPINASVTSVRLEFDLALVSYTSAQSMDFCTIHLPSPDGGAAYRTYLSFQNGSGVLTTDKGSTASFSFPADGAWHTYRLDLTLQPSLTFEVRVDDPAATRGPVVQLSEPSSLGAVTNASFYLGADVYGPANPVQQNFDNVVFDGT